MTGYVVATVKPWNLSAYKRHISGLDGDWRLVETPDALVAAARVDPPRYIFFPHWSWKVPEEILSASECVCFHMTDLPYGRGGSPLQNLIARGHRNTCITALRMVDELDAGPVYAKRALSLDGRAQAIYERAANIVFDMIIDIVRTEPSPQPQEGEVTVFRRRLPEMSRLPEEADLQDLYDHIRMLDAETYPPAYIDYGLHRLEFHDATLQDGELSARVTLRPKP